MADVTFFDAFGYKWALTGPTEILQDDQYKLGWSFIGAVPPSVEQFNRVHQVADEKANYLYGQMAAVFAAAGEVPSAGDLNSLRDSLGARYQAINAGDTPAWVDPAGAGGNVAGYAVGASVRYVDGLVYTSNINGNTAVPGVGTSWRLEKGQLIAIQVLGSSGTYTRTAGATSGRLRMVGGGAGGSGSIAAPAGQISLGTGGGGGAYGEHHFIGNLPASQAYVIGAGGSGGGVGSAGGAGGTTTFGALSAPGAPPSPLPSVGVPPVYVASSPGALQGAGCNILNSAGFGGSHALGVAIGSFISGGGGGSPFGGGGSPIVTASADGFAATTRGTGGAGGATGEGSSGRLGGPGAAGVIIIEEYS